MPKRKKQRKYGEVQRRYAREYYHTHPAYQEYVKRRLHAQCERNTKIVAALKSEPCTDCGKSYPPYVMDFDHVRGKKAGRIAVFKTSRCLQTVLAEIDKCDLVCANCHRERTEKRRLNG